MAENPGLPQPDPALKQFDRFIGRWTMKGGLVGADQTTITGEAAYRWLPGGFFLEHHVQLDFMGLEIDSLELIGYDRKRTRFRPPCSPTCHPFRSRTGGRSRVTR